VKLVLLRKDIRILDHASLYRASFFQEGVIALYIANIEKFKNSNVCCAQLVLVLKCLQVLKNDLESCNIPLIFKDTSKYCFSDALISVINKYKVNSIYMHSGYDPYEIKEQNIIEKICQKQGIDIEYDDDQLILDPNFVKTVSKTPFKMFTPFYKFYSNHQSLLLEKKLFPKPLRQPKTIIKSSIIPKNLIGFSTKINCTRFASSYIEASKNLDQFLRKKVSLYSNDRDFPFKDATSHLSASLALGFLSINQCIQRALKANSMRVVGSSKGLNTWISELIWREFYRYIVVHFPHIFKNKPFKLEYEQLRWTKKKTYFKDWCEGNTGIPIIDAAMKQLNTTGWMHNRLRMIVASFLVKNCNVDWHNGEQYFYTNLVDADFASNNGGWQWCSSVGVDAAPYFRIMNPYLQSKRFDPNGEFIAKFLPDFEKLNPMDRHEPTQCLRESIGYCNPIVDVKKTRMLAINRYKNISRKKL
jgi:deoxyribodipyrimidine photo-lyase